MPSTDLISIVIPVYNEADSLAALLAEIQAVAEQEHYDLEVIFVDDGSTDESWQVIRQLADRHPQVRAIRFRRNFGKAAGLSAGFAAARGKFVFTLDADLQDDPREMPRFLSAIHEGRDVVSGWKQTRHDPWHKVLPSRVFNWLVGYLTGVKLHDHNCGFKCYRREVLGELQLYGEMHRFIPVLAAARGFKAGEIAVNHRPRKFGVSKYGFRRFFKGFLDLLTVYFLTGFGQRPQHLLGTVGLLSFLLGGVGLTYLGGYWLVNQIYDMHWTPLHDRPLVIYSLGALLLGAQLMSVGFLAELLTAQHARSAQSYSIVEQIGGEAPGKES